MNQAAFITAFAVSMAGLSYSLWLRLSPFRLLKPVDLSDHSRRIARLLKVALAQSKILRWRWIGLAHALVFWGFLLISFGSLEMIIDGLSGREKSLAFLGWPYTFLSGAGDIFAGLVLVMVFLFILRRSLLHVSRFDGNGMLPRSHYDALLALGLIAALMLSLTGMNLAYLVSASEVHGSYPLSSLLRRLIPISSESAATLYPLFWWTHILLILAFANILPWSKHFHIFTSIPSVYFARLEPLLKLDEMKEISREVKAMLGDAPAPEASGPSRFGVKDVQDGNWRHYLNSLACTECGRCVSVCPAAITGKLLSPRKIFMDFRARMKDTGGAKEDAGQELLRARISEEELWACNTCGACTEECPVDIHHPSLIVDMRRYLSLEEGSMPSGLKTLCANIENNGAPWKFSAQDRLNWTRDLLDKNSHPVEVPLMSERHARGERPEYLFWVGCAGAFDEKARKTSRALALLLKSAGVDYAVLGSEESCTGDAARRAGNEMLFVMQALNNIRLLKQYEVKKIITTCPHCYNTFKNEYPDFGGHYQVLHHSELIRELISSGRLKVASKIAEGKSITYHDPCYLGRGNGQYESPRWLIRETGAELRELARNRSSALCCGAGGAQVFKESEKGSGEVSRERISDVEKSAADILVTACPFCRIMLQDASSPNLQILDLAELWEA